jgi:hypothetical protein
VAYTPKKKGGLSLGRSPFEVSRRVVHFIARMHFIFYCPKGLLNEVVGLQGEMGGLMVCLFLAGMGHHGTTAECVLSIAFLPRAWTNSETRNKTKQLESFT